jgi:hypothetical protein
MHAGAERASGGDIVTLGSSNWAIVLGLFALGNVANGLWMLAAPEHWYFNLPARVPGTGPLNEHFVRDIGCTFLLLGVGLAIGAARPRWRFAAVVAAAAWSGMHALVHVYDTTRGLLGPEYWAIDLPGVYAPAILLTLVAWFAAHADHRA